MTDTTELVRPPHVSPARWYDPRTPWSARRRVVDEWNRQNRPTEVTYETGGYRTRRIDAPTTAELLETVPAMLAQGMGAELICADLGMSLSAIEQRFRKVGRKDLALPFLRARNAASRTPCADCGDPSFAECCRKCAGARQGRARMLDGRDGAGRFTRMSA